jgi:hypothetical protein
MLAYLGCVAGIVGALMISFIVYFSPPAHPAHLTHTTEMVAKPSAAKADRLTHVVATVAPDAPAPEQVMASPPTVAATTLPKEQASRAQAMRRQVQEERAKRWAYQQDPDFETRFLSYAN